MIRRCRKFVADLFKGPGNKYWDLGRILTAAFGALMIVATSINIGSGEPIDLASLGGGLAALLTAGAALIAAKDWAHSKQPPDKE